MGAYQIFEITFKVKEARDCFEKKIKLPKRRLFQYKYEDEYECVYYMGWDGYGLGVIVLDKMKKLKIFNKIKSFYSMDLSCKSQWYNELKQYNLK